MHRPSQRQAQLEARQEHRRAIQRLVVAAPEPYTAMGERPLRAVMAGVALAVVVTVVIGVLALAGASRAERLRQRPAGAMAAAVVEVAR